MIYGLLIIFGLALGSFVNALVWRLHELEKTKKASDKARLSITKGRSMCPHCKHELAAHDLIPVLSWILLKGRCRYCQKPISWQYPLVELLTAGLFVLSYTVWPYGFDNFGHIMFIGWLVVLTGLIALAVYDLKWMLLPNRIVYPLLVFWSITVVTVGVLRTDVTLLLEAIYGFIAIGGTFWLLFQLSAGKWIGGGDVKLGFLLGLIVGGFHSGFLVIFFASVLGTLFSLPLIARGKLKKTSRIPFGPFLITAAILVFLLGTSVIEWIQHNYLFV